MAFFVLNRCNALCLFLIVITSAFSAYGQLFDSNNYPQKPVCEKLEEGNTIKLKCQWRPFINYMKQTLTNSQNKNNSASDKSDKLFDIEFVNEVNEQVSNEDEFQINDNLFSLFRLRSLTAKGLNLKSVSIEAFSKCCEHLQLLDLSKNDLVRIDRDTLKPLTNLKVLRLSKNKIQFEKNNFENNKMLEEILIDTNSIQYLPETLFDRNENLKTIDISDNNFKKLKICTFSSLKTFRNQAEPNVKTKIVAHTNPIDCDDEVFYLARIRTFDWDLICKTPTHLEYRHLSDLVPSNETNTYNHSCDNDPKPDIRPKEDCPSCDFWKAETIALTLLLVVFVLLALVSWAVVVSLTMKLRSKDNKYKPVSTQNPDQNQEYKTSPGAIKILTNINHV